MQSLKVAPGYAKAECPVQAIGLAEAEAASEDLPHGM